MKTTKKAAIAGSGGASDGKRNWCKKELSRKTNRGISTVYAAIGMIGLLIVGFVVGYYVKPSQPASGFEEDSAWRTASIKLSGSTTVLPIANASAIAFMNMYNETTVTVQGGGSGVGYSQIISGVVDIGMASRPPKSTEIDNQQGVKLWLHPIALDAVCVVVNPSVASSLNLTLQEAGKIFAGIYTYWDEVKSGLPHQQIYIVVRESGSGTRGTFEEYTMDPWDYTVAAAHEKPSNPAVKGTIETTDYSIGYVGFGFLSENMVPVALAEEGEGFISPTIENIQSGVYPISRYLYFVTSSLPSTGSLADRFIDFVQSPEGQQIVESQGFLELPVTYNYP